MRSVFIRALTELAKDDPACLLLSADIGAIVFDDFRARFPQRFINCGVSEQNMVGVAAGLAMAGRRPLIYTIIPFLTMRAFEQIRVDVCMQHLPVVIVGVGAGLTYPALGPTHHAIEDLALMRALPGMTVIAPADPHEAGTALAAAYQLAAPVYLRLGTSGEPTVPGLPPFRIGAGQSLRPGGDATLFACGTAVSTALAVAKRLATDGISLHVVALPTLKPLDAALICACARNTPQLFTLEEHSIIGGLGDAVADAVTAAGIPCRLQRFGIPDRYLACAAPRSELLQQAGLDAAGVTVALRRALQP